MRSIPALAQTAAPPRRGARSRAIALALCVAALLAACGVRRPVVDEPLRARPDKTPVVLLPGITGSQLRDRDTGEVVWGNARSFFRPRDGGYSLVPPLDGERDRLEAFAPIREVRFGPFRVDVYESLARLMQDNGYRVGDLSRPEPRQTFFFFPYDWRYGSASAARELAARLERLRRVRGERILRVDLIAQSNAARIVRWYLKYGGASLEEVEAGRGRPPASVEVRKVILVGTANGGALRTLRDLQRGRRYVPLIGRRFRPETLSRLWSIYEALPVYLDDPFVDGEGRPLEVDLQDPASWRRFGWGIYRPATERRVERSGRTDLFGDGTRRAAFLDEALSRARRLQRALKADVPVGPTRYYLIQNAYRPTPERARLLRHGDGWRTSIRIEKDPDGDFDGTLLQAPGDGHATVGSQMWLSAAEIARLARPPVYVDQAHRRIIASRATHRWILTFLAD